MFKKIIFPLAILICLSSTALAAEDALQVDSGDSAEMTKYQAEADMQGKNDKDKEKDKEKKKKEVKEKIKDKQSKKTKLKKAKDFKSITECNSRASRDNVAAYVKFTCENDFADERLEIINRILETGTTVQTLRQVYEFWLTTDEDFAMVEQICALENTYFSEYWYENAFNKLTNYAHGALTGAEIREYQEAGISNDQILAANVMCRKKGQNIHTILDSVLAGNTIESQAKAIYGTDLVVGDGTLFDAVTKLAKTSKSGAESLALDDEVIVKDDIFYDALNDIITDELSELNLIEDDTTIEDDYAALKNSNYPISAQRALMNKGFTPQEIEKSAQIDERSLFKAAKMAREMLKNEK